MFSAMREYIQDDGAREAFDLLLTVENLVPAAKTKDVS